jgi:hypothetical protein
MAVMAYKSLNQYTGEEAGILPHRNRVVGTDVCSRNKTQYIKTKVNF